MLQATIENLAAGLRGNLIQPSDDGYDTARKVFNAMIDKRPAVIVQCADVADVIAAVNFGRDTGLAIAIRGGGHNGPGLGTVDDGLVIDLSPMKGVRVDPTARVAQVEGGCVLGSVDHATHAFGLATPAGFVSTTGIGGLTLGGGIGFLTRKYGLTIDNLLGVDMVLADGSFVHADEKENPDLFWAVRGGGGNFGVVTSFRFCLHPVDMIYGGFMMWPMERAEAILKSWRDFILTAPEDISGVFNFLTVPPAPFFPEQFHLQKACVIAWCDTAPIPEAEKHLALIRSDFGNPAMDLTGPMPYPALQSMFDDVFKPGLQWYWKADFFTVLEQEAIDLHIKHAQALPTMLSGVHIYPINGAAQRVGKNDTAFSFREANFAEVIVGVDPDPANNEKMISWAREYWKALHPYSAGGAYVNMIMEEGQDQIKAAYQDNYERLVRVKDKYDPTNLFHVNQNIRPSM